MDGKNAQELFLLEFLVDRVNIPSVQAMQEDLLAVKTCIEFKVYSLSTSPSNLHVKHLLYRVLSNFRS